MTPETMFTAGALRQAARAGQHAERGEDDLAQRCQIAAREEYGQERDALLRCHGVTGARRRKRRAAAGWCIENGIGPGDKIEANLGGEWVPARVTGLGESAILVRRKACGEFDISEPTKIRLPSPAPKGDPEP